uniref:Uncharacterized protein n=1 Tax=Anguilla anguilla TaxID=7936 RepID=A0A0E9V0N3_ANGAN
MSQVVSGEDTVPLAHCQSQQKEKTKHCKEERSGLRKPLNSLNQ